MKGIQIIARVIERAGITEEQFFGRGRKGKLTEARVMAIQELTALGYSAAAIGRLIRRDHVSVLYWQKPELRAKRSAYYQARHDQADQGRTARREAKAEQARLKREASAAALATKKAARRPQKLRLSSLISKEPAPSLRVERTIAVPPRAIDDARRRASAGPSFFGDPPPGHSALDRRKAEARV